MALLSERSCFAEIGKINVWSQERKSAATMPSIHYAVLALDTVAMEEPLWMRICRKHVSLH